jgi:hypothetical protein
MHVYHIGKFNLLFHQRIQVNTWSSDAGTVERDTRESDESFEKFDLGHE